MAGYAGKIALVDLTEKVIGSVPTRAYSNDFLGGRGLACKLYWQQAQEDTRALEPENPLIFAAGPLAGFARLSGSRCQVCAKSPSATPERFSYGSMGGSWGPYLRFAGFDAISIRGKAERPVYLFLSAGSCEIRDASHLWGQGTIQSRETLKRELGNSVRVVAIGPAGENLVCFASLLADDNASVSGGLGAVMGSKMLKAIVVSGNSRIEPAHPDSLRALGDRLQRIRKLTPSQVSSIPAGMRARRRACHGCIAGCVRSAVELGHGRRGKYHCQNSTFYEGRAKTYYGQRNQVPLEAGWLCDDYGLDTLAVEAMVTWLAGCYRAGILTDEQAGMPLSRLGSLDFIESLVRKVSLREGFGETLASGIFKAAEVLGSEAQSLLAGRVYVDGTACSSCPRTYLTTALLYATEPRRPMAQLSEVSGLVLRWLNWVNGADGSWVTDEIFQTIAERYWGGKAAADLSTYDGKALAAKEIQDRWYVKESLGVCLFSWTTVEIEYYDPEILSDMTLAVTGRWLSRHELNRIGERIFNLQRAILVMEGHRDRLPDPWHRLPVEYAFLNPDCLVPGSEGKPVSRTGHVVDRRRFEEMRGEYYRLRGWDVDTGLQTVEKLNDLGLKDVAIELLRKGLAKQ